MLGKKYDNALVRDTSIAYRDCNCNPLSKYEHELKHAFNSLDQCNNLYIETKGQMSKQFLSLSLEKYEFSKVQIIFHNVENYSKQRCIIDLVKHTRAKQIKIIFAEDIETVGLDNIDFLGLYQELFAIVQTIELELNCKNRSPIDEIQKIIESVGYEVGVFNSKLYYLMSAKPVMPGVQLD